MNVPDSVFALSIVTTGPDPAYDEILALGLVDPDGHPVFYPFCKPRRRTYWPYNGILPSQVFLEENKVNHFDEYLPLLLTLLSEKHVVIYDAAFAQQFILGFLLGKCASLHCCQRAFDAHIGMIPGMGNVPLSEAAHHAGYVYDGPANPALAAAQMTLAVWNYLPEHDRRDGAYPLKPALSAAV
jgi:hypothetical protein